MIFQLPLNLDIEDKIVQAIIDLDTGFIGFSETIDDVTFEYYYNKSPLDYRKALLNKLKPLMAEKSLGNLKICRKDEKMQLIHDIICGK
jgi:hypothetical protein